MGRGGRRVGAGRKPGSKPKIARKRGEVVNMKGERLKASDLPPELPPASTVEITGADAALLEPPVGFELSDEAVKIWRLVAPYAITERTLVTSRVSGFSQLCEEWEFCLAFKRRIREVGIAASESDRLLKRLNDYKKLLRSSLADFNLSSFGKPAAPEKPKANVNPFSKLS